MRPSVHSSPLPAACVGRLSEGGKLTAGACVGDTPHPRYTLLSDARRALQKLRTLVPPEELPTAFKFVIARKSLNESVRSRHA